jgi:hypothetical protein
MVREGSVTRLIQILRSDDAAERDPGASARHFRGAIWTI